VAVITGSSPGLGAAAAKRLARDGFFVVNYEPSKADGEQTLRELQQSGGKGAALAYKVATLYRRFGYSDEARALAERAITFTESDQERSLLSVFLAEQT
jgi:NAD(P)-dependent dehydrogenase (short-subunit alcohol dehydrogenase family)